MANTYILPVFTLLFIMLLPICIPAMAAFSWRDDFNYQNISELTSAGWTATEVYLNNGTVSPIEPIVYRARFPQQLYDFSFEAKQMIGNLSSFGICTERHNYTFTSDLLSDGTFGYSFAVDGQTELQLTQFQKYSNAPELYYAFQWHILTLQKRGNLFDLYVEGTLRGSYTQSDDNADGLVNVELSGYDTFDYVSVSSLGLQFELGISIFLIALVILFALIASVFLFWLAHAERLRRRKKRANQKIVRSLN